MIHTTISYPVMIAKLRKKHGYFVCIPDLDTVTQGRSFHHAIHMAKDAIVCDLETRKELGLPIPQPFAESISRKKKELMANSALEQIRVVKIKGRIKQSEKKISLKYWRFSDCDGAGGLILAPSSGQARKKLSKKYGTMADNAQIWPWEEDEYFDPDHPNVFDVYGN